MANLCRFLTLVAMSALGACSSTPPVFTAQGYQQPNQGYQVKYLDSGARRVLSSDWRLDNYYGESLDELRPKSGDIYESEIAFDLNGDGEADKTEILPTFDLRYLHLRTAGRIWLRSIPVATHDGNKALSVFLQGYLDAISGAGYDVALFGMRPEIQQKRYAARLISSVPATLASREGLASIIELANVDEIHVSPDARRERIKLVLVRPGMSYRVTRDDGAASAPFPILLVVGYANQPEFFEQNLSEFDALLQRISIGGVAGYRQEEASAPSTGPR